MKKNFLFVTLLAAVVLFPLGCAEEVDENPGLDETTVVETQPAMNLTVGTLDPYGAYLTDAQGRAVYLFTADTDSSTCYDACAEAWPPVLAMDTAMSGTTDQTGAEVAMPGVTDSTSMGMAAPAVDQALYSTMARADGQMQVTYAGHPLYYFQSDAGAGEATGQNKEGFGGEWHLVSPAGMTIDTAPAM